MQLFYPYFKKQLQKHSFNGLYFGELEFFTNFLKNRGLSQVPLLNSKSIRTLQPNTLVRFRGMIQDLPGSEFFDGAYKDGDVWRTNKYADVPKRSVKDYPGEPTKYKGCNDWTEPSGSYMHLETFGNKKRQRDEDSVIEDAKMVDAAMEDDNDIDLSFEAEEFPCPKRMREGNTATSSSSLHQEDSFKMEMVPSEVDIESLSCLVKMYHFERYLKLNAVYEFVGILSVDQENSMKKFIKVPRLHCLVHQQLLLGDFVRGPVSLEPKPQVVKPIREVLLAYLTSVLGKDGLAAEFMLLHLLSGVYSRKDDNVPKGKLALNLTSLTNERLYQFKTPICYMLENLLPFTHDLPLAVEVLNSGPLAPKIDKILKRLKSGALQLANGSHLTIDTTQLKFGSLNSIGIHNIRALKRLLELQEVDYGYATAVHADVQLLILSEGTSNILPADLVLPFHPTSVSVPESPNADTLAGCRWYFATMRSLNFFVSDETSKAVTNDRNSECQNDPIFGRTTYFNRLVQMALSIDGTLEGGQGTRKASKRKVT